MRRRPLHRRAFAALLRLAVVPPACLAVAFLAVAFALDCLANRIDPP